MGVRIRRREPERGEIPLVRTTRIVFFLRRMRRGPLGASCR
ncbi:hypothetical protein [Crossiella sp. SN42]|nr:hypothetical protein [Crossiella sp. SN42]